MPLPHKDFQAETVEERLVMYADKFHSKSDALYFNTYEWYKKYAAKFGEGNATKFEQMAKEFGVPDLAPFVENIIGF